MPHPSLPKATIDEILRLRRQGLTLRQIGEKLGIHPTSAGNYIKKYAEDSGRTVVSPKGGDPEDGPPPADAPRAVNGLDVDGSCEVLRMDRPPSIEEVIEACGVDRTVWVPKIYRPNTWQGFFKVKDGQGFRKVQLHQSRVVFQRVVPECMADAITAFVREHVPPAPLDIVKSSYVTPRAPALRPKPQVVSWGLWDAHLGMYAWNEEVGNSFDLKIATNRIMNSIDDMVVELSRYPIEKVWMPVGNDFLHFDSVRKKTAFGDHPLDTDSRFAKCYRAGLECLVHMVERALELTERVEVIYVPGNHDTTTSYTLCVALACHFRNEPRVVFDLRANPRKYVRHGGTVILYDHGDGVKASQYPKIFAQEARDLWAQSTYREVQRGHTHQRAEVNYEGVVPTNGFLVRTNPALCNTDAWHHKQGLLGEPVKSVEAWRYDEVGYRGSHVVWARDDERK